MKTNIISRLAICSAFVAVMAVCSSASAGLLTVTITVAGGDTITVEDNIGLDTSATVEKVEFTTILNGYEISGVTARSNSGTSLGENKAKLSTAATIEYVGTGGSLLPPSGSGTLLTIYASMNDFGAPLSPPAPAISATTSGTILFGDSGTADFWSKSYLDTTNVVSTSVAGSPISEVLGVAQAGFNGTTMTDSATFVQTIASPPSALFALNLLTETTLYSGGPFLVSPSGSVTLTAIPEPASMAIWACLSGAGMVVAARKRRKQNVA